MKAKTIRATLVKKTEEWIATVEDEALQKLLTRDVIVTGGAIASMLLKEPVNDFDIYFRTAETAKAAAEYYVAKFIAATGHPMKVDTEDGRIRIVTSSGHRGETAGEVKTLADNSAYFCQLISAVKAKDPERINAAYLIEIIDMMF